MKISISKQQLAALPSAHYTGEIVIIDNPDCVDEAIDDLRKAELIGYDTEPRPSFKKGQSYDVSLMQLSSEKTSYLFRLNKIGLPSGLKALLEDESKVKIGLSIHDDFRNLGKSFDIKPKGFIELQEFVTRWSIADKSLSKLYGILFGERLSKSQRLSNWEAEQLAESQQHYAALDALACIRIYRFLSEGNFKPEECSYQIEENAAEN